MFKQGWQYLLRWVPLAFLIGSAGGLIVWVLQHAVAFAYSIQGDHPLVYACPIIAGVILGFVIHRIDPAAAGEGVPAYIVAVNQRGGYVRPRMFLCRFIGAMVTLGLHGSGGFVGPTVLVSSGVGGLASRVARPVLHHLGFRKSDHRLAAICGAGGAIGALLHAPLGGGIFAVEVLYVASVEYEGFFPAILASAAGYFVHGALNGQHLTPMHGGFSFSLSVAPGLMLAAATTGLLGAAFVLLYKQAFLLFQKITRVQGLKTVVGGACCTAAGLIVGKEVMGTSLGTLDGLLSNSLSLPIGVACLLIAGKMFSTAGTIGSGCNAGLTLPVLVLGALAGDLISTVGGVSAQGTHTAFVVTGITAMLSAVMNVPIASAVIAIEFFGREYAVPAILGSVIAFSIARPQIIYEQAAGRKS